MAIHKTKEYDKMIEDRFIRLSECVILSEANYTTSGEMFIVVRDINFCKIKLDHMKGDHIKIKSFTNTLVFPDIGKIDEQFTEISIDNGACVEFKFIMGNWYVFSSDGLKQPL